MKWKKSRWCIYPEILVRLNNRQPNGKLYERALVQINLEAGLQSEANFMYGEPPCTSNESGAKCYSWICWSNKDIRSVKVISPGLRKGKLINTENPDALEEDEMITNRVVAMENCLLILPITWCCIPINTAITLLITQL